jgi:hypothetical protein
MGYTQRHIAEQLQIAECFRVKCNPLPGKLFVGCFQTAGKLKKILN